MEEIEDIIQCSICREEFTDPRMLPCIHTFCLKCLQKVVLKMEKQQSRDKLHCPVCRMEIAIPPQGVDGFRKNFFVHKLKAIKTITEPMKMKHLTCDICLESMECDENEIPTADVYCFQCHKYICKRCSRSHKSIAELKAHQLIQIGTEMTEDMLKTISHQSCARHQSEQAKMYCSDCKEVICVICFAENHQNHKCSGVEKLGNSFRQELSAVTNEIDVCLNGWLRKMQQCTDEKTNVHKNVANIEQSVINSKNELIAAIDKCAHSLLEELASMRQTRLKQVQNEIEESERQLVIIESFKAYCKQIEAKGTNAELCQVFPTLKRRAEELQEVNRTVCQQPTEVFQLDFEQANFEELSKFGNALGRIRIVSDSIRSSGKLDIPSSSTVNGVTKLENQICVLCSNMILIFHDQGSFDLQMQIDLKQTARPRDIASCENSKCLYIKEEFNKCIWKITPEDHSVTKWLTGLRKGQGRLSVTNEGHLLLMTHAYPHELEIYTTVAELILRVPLPSDICFPQHIIRNSNGEFIISHREGSSEGPWLISRLTSDAQAIIGRFNTTYHAQRLNLPFHLSLDSVSNRLFVADHENDRVILLDPVSLNFLKILLTKSENGISRSTRLSYDEKKKQLIVGHSWNKVDVYEFYL